MSMEFSEQALVLQVGRFKEADLWVRLLSPARGIFSAFAFGGSRSRRRFVGCLDLFNEISVRVSGSNRTPYLTLQEGVLLRGVSRLRRDWRRFGLAVNCIRFLQSFGVPPDGAEKTHFLLDQTLRLLEESEDIPGQLPFFFRARLAFDQGYALGALHCSTCGGDLLSGPARLFLRDGQVLCRGCAATAQGMALPLGPATLEALAAVHAMPPALWAGIALSPDCGREFSRAVDGFIQYHVGISWERGRFVRQ